MKQTLLFFSFFLYSLLGYSQFSFSDDFESYSPGDYLGVVSNQWTTWSNDPGSSEDVKITTEKAHSGNNSIKFVAGSSNGGPQDVVQYFGEELLNSGLFTLTTYMYVIDGAYFNFQGDRTIGKLWSMNAFFTSSGNGSITGSSNNTLIAFTHPVNEWFEIKIEVNLDANQWTVSINGECMGSFSNPDNVIASIDIYPTGGNSFFVDDFSYEYNPEAPAIEHDLAVSLSSPQTLGFTGAKTDIKAHVKNNGTSEVTSFEYVVNGDIMHTIVDISILPGETYSFDLFTGLELLEGTNKISINITSTGDQNDCNDAASLTLKGVTPAPHKKVVVEEATGTWCGWCPRGAVALERFSDKYKGRFIGIAVHNGDPMADQDYNGGLNAGSFPNAVVNRGGFMDPSEVENPFLDEVQTPSMASFTQGASWDSDTRELKISTIVTAQEPISANQKIAIALTEDGVTGTGNGWAQANYYSGSNDLIDIHGTNWKDLPNPVSNLEYDHVGRAILPEFGGMPNSFENGLMTGEEKIFNFSMTLPESFNMQNMHVITMLINSNGTINTAESNTIQEAIENGFVISDTKDFSFTPSFTIAPNPTNQGANVYVNLLENSDVTATLKDMSGKTVLKKFYPAANGLFSFYLDTTPLKSGMYLLEIAHQNGVSVQKMMISK